MGFKVIRAKDGADALKKYQVYRRVISLVIVDMTESELEGFEVIEIIREIDPSAKIILSNGSPERVPLEVMPDAFLPKPYKGNALWEVVRRVIQRDLPPVPWATAN